MRIPTGLLGFRYGIADLVAKKARTARYILFQTLAAVDARGIFCITDSLVRWRIRRLMTWRHVTWICALALSNSAGGLWLIRNSGSCRFLV